MFIATSHSHGIVWIKPLTLPCNISSNFLMLASLAPSVCFWVSMRSSISSMVLRSSLFSLACLSLRRGEGWGGEGPAPPVDARQGEAGGGVARLDCRCFTSFSNSRILVDNLCKQRKFSMSEILKNITNVKNAEHQNKNPFVTNIFQEQFKSFSFSIISIFYRMV